MTSSEAQRDSTIRDRKNVFRNRSWASSTQSRSAARMHSRACICLAAEPSSSCTATCSSTSDRPWRASTSRSAALWASVTRKSGSPRNRPPYSRNHMMRRYANRNRPTDANATMITRRTRRASRHLSHPWTIVRPSTTKSTLESRFVSIACSAQNSRTPGMRTSVTASRTSSATDRTGRTTGSTTATAVRRKRLTRRRRGSGGSGRIVHHLVAADRADLGRARLLQRIHPLAALGGHLPVGEVVPTVHIAGLGLFQQRVEHGDPDAPMTRLAHAQSRRQLLVELGASECVGGGRGRRRPEPAPGHRPQRGEDQPVGQVVGPAGVIEVLLLARADQV